VALTTAGIAMQIASALHARQKYSEIVTINDCKVVLNHLIRKFSEPLDSEGKLQERSSKNVVPGKGCVREHLMPVLTIMEEFIGWDECELMDLARRIEQRLRKVILIVLVTDEEDKTLRSNGLNSKMPVGYKTEGDLLYGDIWARYKEAGIFENIIFD